jgi:hypothetical protein
MERRYFDTSRHVGLTKRRYVVAMRHPEMRTALPVDRRTTSVDRTARPGA